MSVAVYIRCRRVSPTACQCIVARYSDRVLTHYNDALQHIAWSQYP